MIIYCGRLNDWWIVMVSKVATDIVSLMIGGVKGWSMFFLVQDRIVTCCLLKLWCSEISKRRRFHEPLESAMLFCDDLLLSFWEIHLYMTSLPIHLLCVCQYSWANLVRKFDEHSCTEMPRCYLRVRFVIYMFITFTLSLSLEILIYSQVWLCM